MEVEFDPSCSNIILNRQVYTSPNVSIICLKLSELYNLWPRGHSEVLIKRFAD